MTKIYTSYTHVAFSVTLSGGKSKRISFSPRTGGGSLFYTDDENVQNAIEKHPSFGTKFFLTKPQAEVKKPAKPAVTKKLEKEAGSEDSASEAPAPEATEDKTTKEIPFTSLSDAKEYLAKTYEIGRTQLRSKEAIKKYAALHGIIFVGIDG